MYTIKEAAARTGLSVPVLRAWERRYGIVSPTRTAGGYRVYDDAALARLRSMRRLVADGWSPSTAAAAILSGTAPEAPDVAAAAPTPAAGVPAGAADAQVRHFSEAAARLDGPRVEAILDEMFAAGRYERVIADRVAPALRALGDAWASGELSVAGEHLASHAVHRRLAAAFQAAGGTDADGPPIPIGMPPGAHHELGALIFATAARRSGLPVVYLGADLPLDDWVAAVDRTAARAVVIGALMNADGAAARAVATGLRGVRPDILVAYGGAAAPEPEPAAAEAGLALRLPDDVAGAVDSLREAVRRLPAA
ncbi:MAG TPA: MerR family transcriptional regulator [Candidatus Limnocylindrales bacterium]|nr:MerR family transcriptional regulator [Candidatus Limnocylindrales bacterium]